MINLLPPESLLVFTAEYRRRRLVVFQFFSLALFLVGIVLVAIFFVSLWVKSRIVATEFSRRQAEVSAAADLDIQTVARDMASELDLLIQPPFARNRVSEIFERFQSHLNPAVQLFSVAYKYDPAAAVVTVTGAAAARGDFLRFVESLKKDAWFISVDSPVANLIKDKDLPFSLTVQTRP